jgi:hypothetical protein
MSRTRPQPTQEIQVQRSTKRDDDTSFPVRRASRERWCERQNDISAARRGCQFGVAPPLASASRSQHCVEACVGEDIGNPC